MVSLGLSWHGVGTLRISPAKTKINQDVYLEILENTYLMDCKDIFGENSTSYTFMQDGASSHTANKAQEWCKSNFPDFMDKKAWPPTSPDLNPLDYFARGYLQREVEKASPQTLESLKFHVRRCVRDMPLDMVKKAVDGFYKRCCMCVEAKGSHFKHMLARKDVPLLEYDLLQENMIDNAEIEQLEVQAEDWEEEVSGEE